MEIYELTTKKELFYKNSVTFHGECPLHIKELFTSGEDVRTKTVNSIPERSRLLVHQYSCSPYWVVTVNNLPTMLILGGKLRRLVKEIKAFSKCSPSFEELLEHITRQCFALTPNKDPHNIFSTCLSPKEHAGYLKKVIHKYGKLYDVPLEEYPMSVTWDLHEDSDAWKSHFSERFRTASSVVLGREPTIFVPLGMIGGNGYNLEIKETDKSFNFYVKYDQILGSRWLVQNFKNESWEMDKVLSRDELDYLKAGSVFVINELSVSDRVTRQVFVVKSVAKNFKRGGSINIMAMKLHPDGTTTQHLYTVPDASHRLLKPTPKEMAKALPYQFHYESGK